MKMPDGKQREFASPLEEWYSAMIKVKAGLNQPQALLTLLEAARKRNLKWHYNNDVWFARKEAYALLQLGNKPAAAQIMRNIVKQKRDWFLLSDLAEMVADKAEALKLMAAAALAFGKLELKVKLFYNLYQSIKDDTLQDAATKNHLLLIARIRMENGWSVPPALEAALAQNEVDLTAVNSAQAAYSLLKPFWQKITNEGQVIHKGIIERLLEGNQSGFIKATDGNKYYFVMKQVTSSKHKAVQGAFVSFELEDGFNKKKQQATKNAVRLIVQ
jgi:cold shock CspA family protein